MMKFHGVLRVILNEVLSITAQESELLEPVKQASRSSMKS